MPKAKLAVLLLLVALTPMTAAKQKTEKPKQTHPDPVRVLQIQTALVRERYLSATSGVWDKPTFDALAAVARAHGWSTCHVPDARVLIALGLGGPVSGMAAPPPDPNYHNHLASELAAYEAQYPERCDTWENSKK